MCVAFCVCVGTLILDQRNSICLSFLTQVHHFELISQNVKVHGAINMTRVTKLPRVPRNKWPAVWHLVVSYVDSGHDLQTRHSQWRCFAPDVCHISPGSRQHIFDAQH